MKFVCHVRQIDYDNDMKNTIIDKAQVALPTDFTSNTAYLPSNLLCFSHLRWEFVYQRPQHLLSRFSEFTNVYFLEEPIFTDCADPSMIITQKKDSLWVCVPQLPYGMNSEQIRHQMSRLIGVLLNGNDLNHYTFWYYTPMALEFSDHFKPSLTVYDCMDELSNFKFAPANIKCLERELFQRADIVFTGGQTLYNEKKHLHSNIHAFPSSIDKNHFSKARLKPAQPIDQLKMNGLKIGFYGVIDERFDYELVDQIASARPDWNIVLIGPVVKIDPAILPTHTNIHYLGPKSYEELPLYLAGWNVAIIPFLINESTRFISPTKTPEYLSAGCPVVSTPITDIVNPYGQQHLVSVADNAQSFINAIEYWLACPSYDNWLSQVDSFLRDTSWDNTCSQMTKLMALTLTSRNTINHLKKDVLSVERENGVPITI